MIEKTPIFKVTKETFDLLLDNDLKSLFNKINPEYVYRMWGGSVAIDEIATGLTELRKNGFLNIS